MQDLLPATERDVEKLVFSNETKAVILCEQLRAVD